MDRAILVPVNTRFLRKQLRALNIPWVLSTINKRSMDLCLLDPELTSQITLVRLLSSILWEQNLMVPFHQIKNFRIQVPEIMILNHSSSMMATLSLALVQDQASMLKRKLNSSQVHSPTSRMLHLSRNLQLSLASGQNSRDHTHRKTWHMYQVQVIIPPKTWWKIHSKVRQCQLSCVQTSKNQAQATSQVPVPMKISTVYPRKKNHNGRWEHLQGKMGRKRKEDTVTSLLQILITPGSMPHRHLLQRGASDQVREEIWPMERVMPPQCKLTISHQRQLRVVSGKWDWSLRTKEQLVRRRTLTQVQEITIPNSQQVSRQLQFTLWREDTWQERVHRYQDQELTTAHCLTRNPLRSLDLEAACRESQWRRLYRQDREVTRFLLWLAMFRLMLCPTGQMSTNTYEL